MLGICRIHLGAAPVGTQLPRGLLYPQKQRMGSTVLGHYALDGPSTDEMLFSSRCSALAVAMQPEILSSQPMRWALCYYIHSASKIYGV